MKRLFTSESVTEGHPDKVCDQISDAILDAYLKEDPFARVACEVSCTTGLILIMGEITSSAHIDRESVARETVRRIGYDRAKLGFDCDTCAVIQSVHRQSPDIALGVDKCVDIVCDIAEMLSLTPSAISHQLKLLKQFRLVKSRREGKTVYYSLADDHVRSIIDTGREHIEE